MFYTPKRQKTTPSPTFDMPPKLRGMMNIFPLLPANHTSSDLILIDSMRIIEDKKLRSSFRTPYDDIMAFLSNVSSNYFTVFNFFFILYRDPLIFHHVISFFALNCNICILSL